MLAYVKSDDYDPREYNLPGSQQVSIKDLYNEIINSGFPSKLIAGIGFHSLFVKAIDEMVAKMVEENEDPSKDPLLMLTEKERLMCAEVSVDKDEPWYRFEE